MLRIRIKRNPRQGSLFSEAARDAKILRNINIDHIKKEQDRLPDEEIRDYFARIQNLERDPEYPNPVFPQGLVDWVESLPDNHFPREGRKRFAKWLGNAVYFHETEILNNLNSVDNPEQLSIHNNDIRYIADYLNGETDLPGDLWEKSLNGMYDLAVQWHDTLKYREDPTGDYQFKEIVYNFDNGFTIVDVNTENDLNVEGEKMGHCVGGYCDEVASGETSIYSLRDPRNNPHATIEVTPTLPLGRTRSRGRVDQIKGKGNTAPVEKYRPMIKQWLQTTDFTYENSPDYLNILSSEEIREKLFTGKLNQDSEQTLARTTKDSEIIRFYLSQILATGYTFGGTDIARVTKLDADSIVSHLLRNNNLNEDHRLSLVKVNFQLRQPLLGVRMATLIGARGHSGTQSFDPASLSSRIWEALSEELMAGFDDEKLYCMQALMELDESPGQIKEDIINHLLSDEYIEGAVKQNENNLSNQQQPYGAILQGYLFQKSPTREQVKRLYTIQRNERFPKVLGSLGRINGYVASSRGMSEDLADEIIKDVKAGKRYAFVQNNWMDMIINTKLSDSKKIEILNIGGEERSIVNLTGKYNSTGEGSGLKWTVSGRSFSRQLVNAAKEKKFSKKLVKYMIDAGVFDAEYVANWVGQKTKLTGRRPSIERYDEINKQKLLNMARERALEEFQAGTFDEDLFEEANKKGKTIMKTLERDIKKYLKNTPQTIKINEDVRIYLKKKSRPWGNIEDPLEEDKVKILEWISQIED